MNFKCIIFDSTALRGMPSSGTDRDLMDENNGLD